MERATLVFNLSKFVIWPEEAFSGAEETFAFCLLGEDDIEKQLALLNGRILNGREAIFRRIQNPLPPADCRVLFIGLDQEPQLPSILKILEGRPIFTVGDIPQFARRGGMVEIVSAGARVSFHINLDAAKRAGLIIKAPLLQIATVIREPDP